MFVRHRLPNESGRPHRLLVVMWSIVITIIVVALQLANSRTSAHELFMLVIPIALLAVGFGLRGGFVGATLATVIYLVWAYNFSTELGLLNVLAFPLTFITVGISVGLAIDSQQHVQEMLGAIVDGTTDAIYVKDSEDRFLMVNNATAEVFKIDRSELLGQKVFALMRDLALMTESDAQRARHDDLEVIRKGVTHTIEDTLYHDGKQHVMLNTKGPLISHSGRVVGLFGISRDITDSKRVQQLELEAANWGRKEYLRARHDYSQLVRHRLMNPLTVIRGNAQTLRDLKTIDPVLHDQLCDLIIESTQLMEQISLTPESNSEAEENLHAVPHVDDAPLPE